MANARTLRGSTLVVIAWVLLQKRRQDGAADKCTYKHVSVGGCVALAIALRSLTIRTPTISRLSKSSHGADDEKRDRIDRRLPSKLELVLWRQRSCIGDVGDVKIRNDAEHPLLLLLLDLHVREFNGRQFDAHLRRLSSESQRHERGDVGFFRLQGPGKILRGETRGRNYELEGPRSDVGEGESSIVV